MKNRACGECSACCEFLGIKELNKPPKITCEHQSNQGCEIYKNKPASCSVYNCAWIDGAGQDDDQPNISRVLLKQQNTQFGNMQVARLLDNKLTDIGKQAIKNIALDCKLPCLIVDYYDSNIVIGMIGGEQIQKQVEDSKTNGVIKVNLSI